MKTMEAFYMKDPRGSLATTHHRLSNTVPSRSWPASRTHHPPTYSSLWQYRTTRRQCPSSSGLPLPDRCIS